MSVGVRRSKSLLCAKGTTKSGNTGRKSTKERCRSLKRNIPSKLTPHQQQALFTSWKSLRPIIHMLMRKILNNLEEEMPKVKQIFCKTAVLDAFNRESTTSEKQGTLDEHVKLMIEFFDDLINNLQDEESVSNKIKNIGQCHAVISNSSFSSNIWEKLGEITMECFSKQDVVQKTREAGKAWRILIAWVTDELRCGFDDQTRFKNR
ncbi:unnamed protein product, partial [Onchocerca ochengi]